MALTVGMQHTEMSKAEGCDGEISSIYVLRSSQRRGLGSALMRTMGQEMRRRQLQGASPWVLRANIGACRFYEAIGSEIVGEKEDINENRVLVEVAYGWRSLVQLAEGAASQ